MPTSDCRASIRVVQDSNDPESPIFTATVAPDTRLHAIVDSLSRTGSLSPAALLDIDPPSFDHVALCLQAHGVALRAASVMEFVVKETAP